MQFLKTKKSTDIPQEEKYFVATPRQLMWWKFKKHKLAVIALFILGLMYFLAAFAEFISPYNIHVRHIRHLYAPPRRFTSYTTANFIFGPPSIKCGSKFTPSH